MDSSAKGTFSRLHGCSGCLGGLVKFASGQERSIGQLSSRTRRQWSSSTTEMEKNVGNSKSNEKHQLVDFTIINEEIQIIENNVNSTSFVNHAAIAWNEIRKEWVGDKSQKSCKIPKDTVISWSTTYDELLSTSQPFPQPIPLPEMVDFLVDIWHEEGLYD